MPEMMGVLSNQERANHMAEAIKRFPLIARKEFKRPGESISIVGYGPSLEKTWPLIRGKVMTVSGAHDYLVDKGINPTWHVDCDPRQHKAEMLNKPQKGTTYLMASCCHPDFWDRLQGHEVQIWHLINGKDNSTENWVKKNQPAGFRAMIGGDSTVGQRAMNVAAMLGYRKFDLYGIDFSFKGMDKHAGPHPNNKQPEALVKYNQRLYKTTPQMMQAIMEMKRFIANYDVDITFHGDGLMQAIAGSMKEKRKS
jgi:hypothetical protein